MRYIFCADCGILMLHVATNITDCFRVCGITVRIDYKPEFVGKD